LIFMWDFIFIMCSLAYVSVL